MCAHPCLGCRSYGSGKAITCIAISKRVFFLWQFLPITIVNYLAMGLFPPHWSPQERHRFLSEVRMFSFDDRIFSNIAKTKSCAGVSLIQTNEKFLNFAIQRLAEVTSPLSKPLPRCSNAASIGRPCVKMHSTFVPLAHSFKNLGVWLGRMKCHFLTSYSSKSSIVGV